jgi:hypothetical protein
MNVLAYRSTSSRRGDGNRPAQVLLDCLSSLRMSPPVTSKASMGEDFRAYSYSPTWCHFRACATSLLVPQPAPWRAPSAPHFLDPEWFEKARPTTVQSRGGHCAKQGTFERADHRGEGKLQRHRHAVEEVNPICNRSP